MTDVAGKAAVVTGGGSGIGMGLAKELRAPGCLRRDRGHHSRQRPHGRRRDQ